jgi:hypothetical protein
MKRLTAMTTVLMTASMLLGMGAPARADHCEVGTSYARCVVDETCGDPCVLADDVVAGVLQLVEDCRPLSKCVDFGLDAVLYTVCRLTGRC